MAWYDRWLMRFRRKQGGQRSGAFAMWAGSPFRNLGFSESVSEGYYASVWAHRCIMRIAESISSVPWKVQTDADGDGTFVDEAGHPIQRLIDRPNPNSDRREFLTQLVQNLYLDGNAFVEIVQDRGVPMHLYHMRPDWVRVVPDPVLHVAGYEFRPPGRNPIPFSPEEVLHFRFVDPLDPYRGCSPLRAAIRTLESENAIVAWNKNVLDNSAVPGGVLKVPSSSLLKEDRDRLREELIHEFSGGNRYRPMVLWGDMEYERAALSHHDLDFLEQRRINKYEICAIFGVPPQLIGANEDPTYSNFEIARLSFWEDVIIPLLDWIQNRLNNAIVPRYGDPNSIRIVYDISDIPAMRSSYEQKVKTAEVLWRMGWPINEINRKLNLGLALVPWGETAWFPVNLYPVSGAAPQETPPKAAPPPSDSEEEDVL